MPVGSLNAMERQDFIELMTPEGQALLKNVAYESKTDVVKLVSRLRSEGHSPALVAAVLTQAKLRHRATNKFGEFAERMLFTEPGLEQASRLTVAALHAGRFRAAGVESVADLGCGIGAESLAFASVDLEVAAFDIDELTAAVATYNLLPFQNAQVEQADVTTLDLSRFQALYFDPARRELKGAARAKAVRKFDPAEFSPNFNWVVELCIDDWQGKPRVAGIKLGPGHPHEGIPEQAEAQWVSVGGDLVELGLWFGAAARNNIKRSALLISGSGRHELNSETEHAEHAPVASIGDFIYEPDNAVVRSHLIGQLAAELGLTAISKDIAYLSGNNEVTSPWLKGYRVLENHAFDRKKLRARLREANIGVLEIKKRGADIVPEQLRKDLALQGTESATMIVTRVGEAHRALICQPL